ncbi:6-phosphofructokinase, partial [Toxoplasma gondii TgCatPRC2]
MAYPPSGVDADK